MANIVEDDRAEGNTGWSWSRFCSTSWSRIADLRMLFQVFEQSFRGHLVAGALIYLFTVNVPTHIGPSPGMYWPVWILAIL